MSVSAPSRTEPIGRRVFSPILALLLALAVVAGCGDDSAFDVADVDTAARAEAAEHSYLIPAGTGAASDAGEPVEIRPADLTVKVGEMFELINEDDRGHLVGPFYVRAGETLRQEFTSAGVYEGICTVHPSGQVKLTVIEG